MPPKKMNEFTLPSFPATLALVKMANGKKYLFRSPAYQVVKGMHVLCKTQNGEQPGTVDSMVLVETQKELDFILETAGISRLEPIIGIINYSYLTDQDTYYRGKGISKPTEPVVATQTKPGDPWICVHMPSGEIYTN